MAFDFDNNLDLQAQLTIAVTNNNLPLVKSLISRGADVNQLDENGESVLHIATIHGHLEVAKYLIEEKKISLNIKDYKNWSPITNAVWKGHHLLLSYLIQYPEVRTDETLEDGGTLLHVAAYWCPGDKLKQVISILLDAGVDITQKNNEGRTAVEYISDGQVMQLMQCAVKKQEDITALFDACKTGDLLQVKQCLQQNKQNIHARDKYDATPLHWAVWNGYLDIIFYLVEQGANVNAVATKYSHQSVLHQAIDNFHGDENLALRIISYLVEHNANPYAKTDSGQTAFELATKLNKPALINCLKPYFPFSQSAFVNTETLKAFRYFRFTPKVLRDDNTQCVQLAVFQVYEKGTVQKCQQATNPGGNNPINEKPDKAVDSNLNSKWLDHKRQPLILDFGKAISIDSYRFATANDYPTRDPISWDFEGSLDSKTWFLLDRQDKYPTPVARHTFISSLIVKYNQPINKKNFIPLNAQVNKLLEDIKNNRLSTIDIKNLYNKKLSYEEYKNSISEIFNKYKMPNNIRHDLIKLFHKNPEELSFTLNIPKHSFKVFESPFSRITGENYNKFMAMSEEFKKNELNRFNEYKNTVSKNYGEILNAVLEACHINKSIKKIKLGQIKLVVESSQYGARYKIGSAYSNPPVKISKELADFFRDLMQVSSSIESVIAEETNRNELLYPLKQTNLATEFSDITLECFNKRVFKDSSSFDELQLIFKDLANNNSVSKLSISHLNYNKDMADKLAFSIAELLLMNKTIKEIDLSNSGITDKGAIALMHALELNLSVEKINLSGNSIQNELLLKIQTIINRRTTQKTKPVNVENPSIPNIDAAVDINGNTALHKACENESLNQVRQLLSEGANPNVINKDKATPLHILAKHASCSQAVEIATALFTAGADSNITDNNLTRPLDIIPNPTQQLNFASILLKKRPQYSKNYVEKLLALCLIHYRGDFETRAADKKQVDQYVGRLTGFDINHLMEQNKWVLLGHLNSLKGKFTHKNEANKIKFEGMWPEDFIPLRIRILFEILVEIKKQVIPQNSLPNKDKAYELLLNELVLELDMLHARKDALWVHKQFVNQDILFESHANNLFLKIKALKPGDFYSYYSGYIRHSIYVNFMHTTVNNEAKILVRLDNLGGGCQVHEKQVGFENKWPSRYYPYVIDFPENYFKAENLPDYLSQLVKAVFLPADKSMPLLYFNKSPYQYGKIPFNTLTQWYTAKLQQSVGNCTVKNLNMGLQIRWQTNNKSHELYHWYRETEVRHIPLKSYGAEKVSTVPLPNMPFLSEEAVKSTADAIRQDVKQSGNKLMQAIIDQDNSTITQLLETNPELIHASTSKGHTALHLAVFFGETALIGYILNKGFSPAKTLQERNVLMMLVLLAQKPNNLQFLNAEIEKLQNQDWHNKQGYTILHQTIVENDVDTALKIIEGSLSSLKKVTHSGYTALHLATIINNITLVRAILAIDISIAQVKNNNGDTALDLALQMEYTELAAEFLKHNVKPTQDNLQEVHWLLNKPMAFPQEGSDLTQEILALKKENSELRLMINSGHLFFKEDKNRNKADAVPSKKTYHKFGFNNYE